MNYFECHLGDWAEDTEHLSALEDGIYFRLVRKYYAKETPLSCDLAALQQITRLHSAAEKAALKRVLALYFHEGDDGLYHNRRCDEEIQKLRAKSERARTSANTRWNGCERNADAMPSHSDRNANASKSHNGRNTLQTPDSRLQSPTPTRTVSDPQSRARPGVKRGGGISKGVPTPERHAKSADELEREEAARSAEEELAPKILFDHDPELRHAGR